MLSTHAHPDATIMVSASKYCKQTAGLSEDATNYIAHFNSTPYASSVVVAFPDYPHGIPRSVETLRAVARNFERAYGIRMKGGDLRRYGRIDEYKYVIILLPPKAELRISLFNFNQPSVHAP